MKKLYLILPALLCAFNILAQQAPALSPGTRVLIKGDSFTIRLTQLAANKRIWLRDALRIAGAGAAAYQTDRIISKNTKAAPSAAGDKWIPPAGIGLVLLSDKLAGNKKLTGQYLRYTLFDKKGAVIQTDIARLDRKAIRKNAGIMLTGKAPEDGFLDVDLLPAAAGSHSAPGFVIDVQSGGRSVRWTPAPVDLSALPRTPVDIAAGLSPSIPVPATRISVPDTHPGKILVAEAPSAKRTPAILTRTKHIPALVAPGITVSPSAARAMPSSSGPQTKKQPQLPAGRQAPLPLPFYMRIDMIKNDQDFRIEGDGQDEDATDDNAVMFAKIGLMESLDEEDDDGGYSGDDGGLGGDEGGGGGDGGDGGDGGTDGSSDDGSVDDGSVDDGVDDGTDTGDGLDGGIDDDGWWTDDGGDDGADDGTEELGDGNVNLPNQVPNSEADDFFDGYIDNGETGVITDYDGEGHNAYYLYESLSDSWVLNNWDGEADPRDVENPGGHLDPTEDPDIDPDLPGTTEDPGVGWVDVGSDLQGVFNPDGSLEALYMYDPAANEYLLEYYDPGGAVGGDDAPSVPGDHSLPARKLPRNNNSNTQVANFCVFKTMEWIAKFYNKNINSGTFALYYSQLKGDATILRDGFKGDENDLNALIAHYFDSSPCNSVKDAIDAGYPVMAYLLNPDGTGHEVFITGYNDNATFEYYDPESGTYKSGAPGSFHDWQQITGAK